MSHDLVNNDLITAGVTVYNAAGTIERAIQSVLAQSWRPLEIVVVDDASTDDTPVILQKLADRYCEIRLFRNERNSGVAASRNRILEEARGIFVAFFDDDDVSDPDRIVRQHRRICDYERNFAHGQPVICHTARLQHYPDGGKRYIRTMGERKGHIAPHGIPVANRILMGIPLTDGYGACATCSQMARLSTYRMLDGFDTSFRRAEDTDLNVRFAMKGGHFAGISEPLVVQTMVKTAEKNLGEEYRNTLLLYEKHRDLFERRNQYDFCLQWLGTKYAYLEGRWLSSLSGIASVFLKHPLWTMQRIQMAVPNVISNRNLGRFYMRAGEDHKDG